MKKIGFTAALIFAAVLGNIATSFFSAVLELPAFFDTIFTVAITFYAGLVPGIIVASLTNPLMTVLRCLIYGTEIFYFDFLYSACGIFIVLTTWTISRNKKEFFFSRAVTVLYLLVIAFASSFLSCFSASFLDTFIRPLFEKHSRFSAIDSFSMAFQKLKFNVFLSYLLPRIPLTVLDRLICTFAGFGIYRFAEKNLGGRNA